jgi:hypothetical protein
MGSKTSKAKNNVDDKLIIWLNSLPGGLPLAARYFFYQDYSTVNWNAALVELREDGTVGLRLKADEYDETVIHDYGKWNKVFAEVIALRRNPEVDPTRVVIVEMFIDEVIDFKIHEKTGFLLAESQLRHITLVLQRECPDCHGFGFYMDPGFDFVVRLRSKITSFLLLHYRINFSRNQALYMQ